MRDEKEYVDKVRWDDEASSILGENTKGGYINLPTGKAASVVVGRNEDGMEHVSIQLYHSKRLPTWNEMCFVKDLFWDDEEEVVQMHPKKKPLRKYD